MRDFRSMLDINTHSNPGGGHPPINLFFLFAAWIFNIGEGYSPDALYQWVFRILSIISLLIVIYNGFDKAKETYRKNNPFKTKKHEEN